MRFATIFVLALYVVLLGCGGGGGGGSTTSTSSSSTGGGSTGGTGAAPQFGNKLSGVDYGPFLAGITAPGGTVTPAQVQNELSDIAPNFSMVRTFSSTGGQENVPAIAKGLGLKVAAGCLFNSTQSASQRQLEIDNLVANCNKGYVDVAIVGNETLQGNILTDAQLVGYINQVRSAISAGVTVKVTTSDTWNMLFKYADVISSCDEIWANFYPFWEGVPITSDIAQFESDYATLTSVTGTKKIVCAETGWPSAGGSNMAAVPSLANGAKYLQDFISWTLRQGVPYCYFEMYDETGKTPEPGGVDSHWGLLTNTLGLKSGYAAAFSATELQNGLPFPYKSISGVPQPVNDLGYLIGLVQADVVTPGGTQSSPGFSATNQQWFDGSGRLNQIVQAFKSTSTFSAGVAALQGLPSATQATVFSAYQQADWPTWTTLGLISVNGTTQAGYNVETEIANALTTAVQQAVSGTVSQSRRKTANGVSPQPIQLGAGKQASRPTGGVTRSAK